jgi:hypothetical protein
MKQKIIKFLILSTSFIVLLLNSCKEKDWRDEMDINNSERVRLIQKDHEYLKSLQRDSYEIQNSSKNKDEAIRNYLDNLSKDYKSEDPLYSFNKLEMKTILYPNTLGYGTVLDNSPLTDYEELVFTRKKLGESLILEKLKPIGRLDINHIENFMDISQNPLRLFKKEKWSSLIKLNKSLSTMVNLK